MGRLTIVLRPTAKGIGIAAGGERHLPSHRRRRQTIVSIRLARRCTFVTRFFRCGVGEGSQGGQRMRRIEGNMLPLFDRLSSWLVWDKSWTLVG